MERTLEGRQRTSLLYALPPSSPVNPPWQSIAHTVNFGIVPSWGNDGVTNPLRLLLADAIHHVALQFVSSMIRSEANLFRIHSTCRKVSAADEPPSSLERGTAATRSIKLGELTHAVSLGPHLPIQLM